MAIPRKSIKRILHGLSTTWTMTLVFFLLASCGYEARLAQIGRDIPFDSIAIPMVKSKVTIPGFEAEITGAIRDEFISHSLVDLVPYEKADVVLVGETSSVETRPLSYDVEKGTVGGGKFSYKVTRLRRLEVRMHVRLLDRRSGKVLWEERQMEEKASYEVGIDPLAIQNNQQKALSEIARSLARKIYLKTVETF